MSQSHDTYQITAGPSKWDLMLALFDNAADQTRELRFDARTSNDNLRTSFDITINGIFVEDGSGESWNIFGRTHNKHVKMHYSTRQRKGMILFTDWTL